MERTVALARLTKIFGKAFRYRENKHWKSHDVRQKLQAEATTLRADLESLDLEITRLREVLLADPVYVALMKRRKALREAKDRVQAIATTNRFEVGTYDEAIPGFPVFHIRAQGNSWEEIFQQLDADGKVKAAVRGK